MPDAYGNPNTGRISVIWLDGSRRHWIGPENTEGISFDLQGYCGRTRLAALPFEWWRARSALVTIFAGAFGHNWSRRRTRYRIPAIFELDTEREATNGKKPTGDLGHTAKEAADNAHDAIGDVNTVEKSAHDLSDLLVSLRAQVRLQTPRWQLLEEGKSSFEDALRPFTGQPITVLTCGTDPEPEAYRLGQELLNFIGKAPGDGSRGAAWITGYDVWRLCGSGGGTSYGGNRITVNNSAEGNVKRAASALKDTLNQLPNTYHRIHARIRPVWQYRTV